MVDLDLFRLERAEQSKRQVEDSFARRSARGPRDSLRLRMSSSAQIVNTKSWPNLHRNPEVPKSALFVQVYTQRLSRLFHISRPFYAIANHVPVVDAAIQPPDTTTKARISATFVFTLFVMLKFTHGPRHLAQPLAPIESLNAFVQASDGHLARGAEERVAQLDPLESTGVGGYEPGDIQRVAERPTTVQHCANVRVRVAMKNHKLRAQDHK